MQKYSATWINHSKVERFPPYNQTPIKRLNWVIITWGVEEWLFLSELLREQAAWQSNMLNILII